MVNRLESYAHLTDSEYQQHLLNVALRAAMQLCLSIEQANIKNPVAVKFARLTTDYIQAYADFLDKVVIDASPKAKKLPSDKITKLYKQLKERKPTYVRSTATNTDLPISSPKPKTDKGSTARKAKGTNPRTRTKAG